jgi:hypothetical protein
VCSSTPPSWGLEHAGRYHVSLSVCDYVSVARAVTPAVSPRISALRRERLSTEYAVLWWCPPGTDRCQSSFERLPMEDACHELDAVMVDSSL